MTPLIPVISQTMSASKLPCCSWAFAQAPLSSGGGVPGMAVVDFPVFFREVRGRGLQSRQNHYLIISDAYRMLQNVTECCRC